MDSSACFQLKGSAFTLTVLQLFHNDLDCLQAELGEKVAMAPQFFNHTPVVIDLHELDEDQLDIDFIALKKIICSFNMIPVGTKGAVESQLPAIADAGLAVLAEAKHPAAKSREEHSEQIEAKNQSASEQNQQQALEENNKNKQLTPEVEIKTVNIPQQTMVITHPVRSGQQIYAPNGDLVIKGAVGAGAEVLADGNIHVYGALRGKAMAGVKGEKSANIFCHQLESDLVSIAGIFALRDDIPPDNEGVANHINLVDERLVFNKM
ncbi:MAG: septum site-determining protein MinC [Gammaproteobacteria bacterium]|nr:septum site-determining protein MinC [Gammaproteobacteria bacterium]